MESHIVVMGRVTAEPELKYTKSGIAVAIVNVAVDRGFGADEDHRGVTEFIDCYAWRETAESIKANFHKGNMIVISGQLKSRQWKDAEGQEKSSFEINVDHAYFGESRRT